MGHLQLNLSIHFCILLCFLVAVVQVFHKHSYYYIDEDKLGGEHEADKVEWRDELQVAETAPVVMSAFTQCVLEEHVRPQMRKKTPSKKTKQKPHNTYTYREKEERKG